MQNVKDQEAKHKQIERTEQSIKHHYNVGGHGKNNTPISLVNEKLKKIVQKKD